MFSLTKILFLRYIPFVIHLKLEVFLNFLLMYTRENSGEFNIRACGLEV